MNESLFSLKDKVAVLTGGTGVLGSAMALALGRQGARVVLLARDLGKARDLLHRLQAEQVEAEALSADVLDRTALETAARQIESRWGRCDILVNGAGGNRKDATTGPDLAFFDLSEQALRGVIDLNLLGAILPSQVFGRLMARQQEGVIVNISSMNSFRPLTKIVGYSAAKAAINNFTQWLAVHLAQNYSPRIRVNAIAPGFFETKQNRFLLREEQTGELTARGKQILDHTPMGRFGVPEDLVGTLIWLVSPASAFVTGVVVPVDGGFSAYSGV